MGLRSRNFIAGHLVPCNSPYKERFAKRAFTHFHTHRILQDSKIADRKTRNLPQISPRMRRNDVE